MMVYIIQLKRYSTKNEIADLRAEKPVKVDDERILRVHMPALNSLLIVEDDAVDVLSAASVARTLGLEHSRTFNSVARAISFLQGCLEERTSLPDVILLDLDLGQESGYELLRIWRTTSRLSKVPLLVWSGLGDHHQELCDVFKVTAFVAKWRGKDALRKALLMCLEHQHPPAAAD